MKIQVQREAVIVEKDYPIQKTPSWSASKSRHFPARSHGGIDRTAGADAHHSRGACARISGARGSGAREGCLFLFGNPDDIAEMVDAVVAVGKVPIVNLDLVSGFARDQAAISFMARRQVHGIISTHPEPLRAARNLGLFAIKRTFLLDSAALQSTVRSLDQFLPDALEVLPAMAAPHIIAKLHEERPRLPIIAGGLVHTLREIEDLVQKGVSSVSVSDCNLWIA